MTANRQTYAFLAAGLAIVLAASLVSENLHAQPAASHLNGAEPYEKGGIAYAVAFSPDSRSLVSAGADGAIRFWNARTGELIRTFEDSSGQVFGLAFAPNGESIASVSLDGLTRLWHVGSGVPMWRVPVGGDHSEAVAFFSNGRRLAIGGSEFAWRIMDAKTGEKLREVPRLHDDRPIGGARENPLLPGNTCRVNRVALSADENLIAASDICGVIALYRSSDGTFIRAIQRRYSYPGGVPARRAYKTTLCFSPDSKELFGGSGDTVAIWDVVTGSENVHLDDGDHRPVTAVSLSPDGRYIAAGDAGAQVNLWRLADHKLLWTYTAHRGAVTINDLAFSPDGKLIAAADFGFVGVLDATTGKLFDFPPTR